MSRKHREKKRSLLWMVIAAVALFLALLSAGIAIGIRLNTRRVQQLQPESTVPPAPSAEETLQPTEEPVVIPVDFDYWQGINPEVYAFISVPGTNVEYPILQHDGDNGYYLHHCIDGTYGLPGSIFTEDYNTKTFDDPVTLVYGHNMVAESSYFNQLHYFEDPDFFKENKDIFIYMPKKVLQYRVFSAYTYDDRHLMYYYDNFLDPQDRRDFIQSIYDVSDLKANLDTSMKVTEEDKLLVLSTCIGATYEPYRFLVVAVLEDVQTVP